MMSEKYPFLIVLVLLFIGGLQKATAQQKPNIIFILTDDQRWDALGYAGNPLIQTPEMDRLASEGVYFENAFVTTPICAASRASILTGRYERTHGYTFGQGDIKEQFISSSYPVELRKHGYYTGFYGKFGVNYGGFSDLFDQGESYDRNGKFDDRRGYFFKTLGQDTVHLTRYTGQKAIDFISSAPKDRPFMLSLSFSAPHAHDPAEDQYFYEEEFGQLYDSEKIDLPLLRKKRFFQALPESVQTGENFTRWKWRYDTPEKYQKSVKGYFRMISEVDSEIGKIREALEEQGVADNTILILMGDNGYFLGERRLAGKWLMYDNSLRVPLMIYDPRGLGHRDVKEMALNIDIASTIYEYAGIPIPKEWQGISLAGYTQGKSPANLREEFICEHLWKVNIIAASEGIRTEKWKYFRYQDQQDWEELYDLENDPLEKHNLAGKKKYQSVLENLRSRFNALSTHLEEKN